MASTSSPDPQQLKDVLALEIGRAWQDNPEVVWPPSEQQPSVAAMLDLAAGAAAAYFCERVDSAFSTPLTKER